MKIGEVLGLGLHVVFTVRRQEHEQLIALPHFVAQLLLVALVQAQIQLGTCCRPPTGPSIL